MLGMFFHACDVRIRSRNSDVVPLTSVVALLSSCSCDWLRFGSERVNFWFQSEVAWD